MARGQAVTSNTKGVFHYSSKSTIHDKGRNFKNLIIEHIGLVLQAKPIQKLDITLSIEYCCKYTIQEQKWLNKNHV